MTNDLLESGYVTVRPWMVSELSLKGADLLIFALLFERDCESEDAGRITGQYMSDVSGLDRTEVLKRMQALKTKGLLKDFFLDDGFSSRLVVDEDGVAEAIANPKCASKRGQVSDISKEE